MYDSLSQSLAGAMAQAAQGAALGECIGSMADEIQRERHAHNVTRRALKDETILRMSLERYVIALLDRVEQLR